MNFGIKQIEYQKWHISDGVHFDIFDADFESGKGRGTLLLKATMMMGSTEEVIRLANEYADQLSRGAMQAGPTDEVLRAEAEAVAWEAEHPDVLARVNFRNLMESKPERSPAVVEGIIREGGVATLIGGSKTRKSWLVGALEAAACSGGQWLGHAVTQGRVALLDGELTAATIYFRLSKIFESMGIPDEAGNLLDVYAMRGRTKDNPRALAAIRAKGAGYYKLIIVDPLYTLYPPDPRFSENDNVWMRRLYDSNIALAEETRAAVVAVHHLSKGSQAEKSLTDLGAGAGAIARAGDAHLTLRPHKEPGAVVFDGVIRDFPEILPTCWQWTFPLFHPAPDLNPLDLAGLKRRKAEGKGESKPILPMPDEFARQFLVKEGRELAHIQALARPSGIRPKTVAQLLAEAVATRKAVKIDGKPGRGGYPPRYASAKSELNNSPSPPHTPPGAQRHAGAGVSGGDIEYMGEGASGGPAR